MATDPRSEARSARGFTQRLKEDGRQTLEHRKRSAADRIEEIAQALGRTGAQFSANEPTIADLANRLAGSVGNLATRLREGSIDDIVDDARAFARRNPGLFVAGGLIAGFALARFAKASARRREEPASALDDDAPTLTEAVEAEVIVAGQGTTPRGL